MTAEEAQQRLLRVLDRGGETMANAAPLFPSELLLKLYHVLRGADVVPAKRYIPDGMGDTEAAVLFVLGALWAIRRVDSDP